MKSSVKVVPFGVVSAEAVASEPLMMAATPVPTGVDHDSYYTRHGAGSSPAKRLIDVILALLIAIFFFPLMVVICLALFVQDGASILYRQERIGQGGRKFYCLKFRTMVRNSEERLQAILTTSPEARREWEETQKLKRDPRVHFVGNILRKLSLDELPQLLNVLDGDMSLVGPRPIVQAEAPRYADRFAHYISVRPGLTGLWQVSGRNNTTYDERTALDARYVEEWSLRLDFFILLKTGYIVFLRRGAY